MSRRTDRMASLIRAELGDLILKKLKDPRIGFVTVTGVEVTPDLKLAKVYYSVLGKEKDKVQTQRALEHSSGFLQHGIAEALKLRFTPKLNFYLDESLDRGVQIDNILREIKETQPNEK